MVLCEIFDKRCGNLITLKLKSLIKDVSKFYGIDFGEVSQTSQFESRSLGEIDGTPRTAYRIPVQLIN